MWTLLTLVREGHLSQEKNKYTHWIWKEVFVCCVYMYTQSVLGFNRKRPLMGLWPQCYIIPQLLFSNESVKQLYSYMSFCMKQRYFLWRSTQVQFIHMTNMNSYTSVNHLHSALIHVLIHEHLYIKNKSAIQHLTFMYLANSFI